MKKAPPFMDSRPVFPAAGGFSALIVLAVAVLLSPAYATVSYDHKAIIVNGQRRILISGSIHYPRGTPEVRPSLSSKKCSFLGSHVPDIL